MDFLTTGQAARCNKQPRYPVFLQGCCGDGIGVNHRRIAVVLHSHFAAVALINRGFK